MKTLLQQIFNYLKSSLSCPTDKLLGGRVLRTHSGIRTIYTDHQAGSKVQAHEARSSRNDI